ncbi:hypothetical protein [Mucilaginibacter sp.]|uniref:hypothetical protein n=1 Tax=Mucilaginibacter sp. TaxID=1882438 RepID=UPI0035BBB325
MKNRQSFFTAFLLSMILVIWYNITLLILNDQPGHTDHDQTGLLLLQVLLIVKFISVFIITMPANLSFKQLTAGFIAADLIYGLPLVFNKTAYSFPPEILIVQILLVCIDLVPGRRRAHVTDVFYKWRTSEEIIIQSYQIQNM